MNVVVGNRKRRCHNKRCQHPGCEKRASFGMEVTSSEEFCVQHKKQGMVNVRSKKCRHPSCTKRPSFGVEGGKAAEFCAQHKKEGMVNVSAKRCEHQSCSRNPCFGVEGTKTREFCAQHKTEGMVDLAGGKCGHRGCNKHSSYGVEGSKLATFCAEHAKENMVNVKKTTCRHPGCSILPSFGVQGGKTVEFCVEHRKGGMVDIRNRNKKNRCHPNCNTQHKKEGMVYIASKRCGHPGCEKQASFGVAGAKIKEFCAQHKEEWMVDITDHGSTIPFALEEGAPLGSFPAAVKVEKGLLPCVSPGAAEAVRRTTGGQKKRHRAGETPKLP